MFLRKTEVRLLQIKKSLLGKVPINIYAPKEICVATPLENYVNQQFFQD